MKLVLSVCRKEGRPGYGSEGATAEVHLEVSEATISANPLSLIEEARRGYALLDQVVSEQLARTGTVVPVATNGHAPTDRAGLPSQARAPSAPEPARPAVNGRANGNGYTNAGPPRDGRALFAWCKRQDEEHDAGLLRYITRWGKLQGYADRMVDWDDFQVVAAVAEADRKLSSLVSPR
jgi:hypothetical protein